jgi:hypothetical protein
MLKSFVHRIWFWGAVDAVQKMEHDPHLFKQGKLWYIFLQDVLSVDLACRMDLVDGGKWSYITDLLGGEI